MLSSFTQRKTQLHTHFHTHACQNDHIHSLTDFIAAAISSYLSACSASLAFCTSCSRSTMLGFYVVFWLGCLICVARAAGECVFWKVDENGRSFQSQCSEILGEPNAAAVPCCLSPATRRRDTPPLLLPLLCSLPPHTLSLGCVISQKGGCLCQ